MKIVIIGGSHAGLSAAESIKKMSREHDIILLEKRDVLGFVPSSLNFILEKVPHYKLSNLNGMADSKALQDLGIDLRLNSLVTRIYPEDKTLEVVEKKNSYSLSYDRLILAMGSEKFTFAEPIQDTDISTLLTYKYPMETKNTFYQLSNSHHVTIIGAGLIGLELASSLTTLPKKRVTVIDQMSRPLFRYFDVEITDILKENHPKNLNFIFGRTLKNVEKNAETIKISMYGGQTLQTDAAVLALNPRPNTALITPPIRLNFDNTVKVNKYMQTDDPNIYAIGDLIKVPFGPGIKQAYLPLISIARRTGLIAASHIINQALNLETSFQRTIATKIFNHYLGSTGITFEESLLLNIPVKEVTKSFKYYSKLYKEEQYNLKIKLIYRTNGHALLGAQLISSDPDSLHLISLFSNAIARQETIESMLLDEYYYSPMLSPDHNFITETIFETFKNDSQ